MQNLLLLSVLVVVPSLGLAEEDPFKPQPNTEWHLESMSEKPFLLEIAYGERQEDDPNGKLATNLEVDSDFLDSANRLMVAVSSNETGEFSEKGEYAVKYRVSENADNGFDLKLHVRTEKDGWRETNTGVLLNPSEWFVLGKLSKSAFDGTFLSYVVAARISPRVEQP